MKTKHWLIIAIAAFGLGGCGGGGSGAPVAGDSPPPTIQAVAGDLESVINRMDGRLPPVSVAGSGSGYSYNLTVEGYALCLPADPFAPPRIPATLPDNIYGCQNTLSLAYPGIFSSTQLRLSGTILELFVDFSGSLSPITSSLEGYLTDTGVTVDVMYALIANGDGTYTLDPAITPVVAVTFNNLTIETNNSGADLIGNLIIGWIAPQIETAVENEIAQVLQQHVQSGGVPNFVF